MPPHIARLSGIIGVSRAARRAVKEPGGLLLIGLGLSQDELRDMIARLYPQSSSLTVLVAGHAVNAAAQADEIWVYAPLGLRGFMALIRRISWRRFEAVYQPAEKPVWLKYLVWPRPLWRQNMSENLPA